ncbi:MAG: flagellar protein FliS, partial [Phycisphaerae bacterium]|nr:flagellar protein FliS [Phycisphaerae bacterium]
EASFNSLDRAQRICLQLAAGLNRDANPEIAEQMINLYNFCYMRLVDANLHRNTKAIDEAVKVLRHQRETWSLIVDKLSKYAGEEANAARVKQEPALPTTRSISMPAATPHTDGDDDEPTLNIEG